MEKLKLKLLNSPIVVVIPVVSSFRRILSLSTRLMWLLKIYEKRISYVLEKKKFEN